MSDYTVALVAPDVYADIKWLRAQLDRLPPAPLPVILEPAETYDTLAAEWGDPLLDRRRRQYRQALTMSVPAIMVALGVAMTPAQRLWSALRDLRNAPPDLHTALRQLVHGIDA